ncbi:hypothetical protein DH86_00003248, partial [Scytalidium sp. 3C]
DYYGNGGAAQRGMPPPNRGGQGRQGGPMQRPPNSGGEMRGDYDQRGPGPGGPGGPPRGNPNGGGRGGRPPPADRNQRSDPGPRRAIEPAPNSPPQRSWDSPFPVFPAPKKTKKSGDQEIAEGIANMDINNRPKTAGSKGSQDYGQPLQNGPAREKFQQQAYPDQQQRAPLPSQGYGSPQRQNGHAESGYDDRGGYQRGVGPTSPVKNNFGPISRAMTMPNDPGMAVQNKRPPPPATMDGPGPSAPYNGPYTRSKYQHLGRIILKIRHKMELVVIIRKSQQVTIKIKASVTSMIRTMIIDRLSKVDMAPNLHRSSSLAPVNRMKSQPDMRARAEPQAAVFEMAGNVPPIPDTYAQHGYADDEYGQPNGQFNDRGPPGRSYERAYNDYGSQNDPAPMNNGAPAGPVGLPNGPGPNRGFNGLPSGPSPHGGPPRSNTAPLPGPGVSQPQAGHPAPVRPGLAQNTPGSQMNSKPPPVRNYNNVSSSSNTQTPPPAGGPPKPAAEPRSVTQEELEDLRIQMKTNPNDQAVQLLLARKLIEASEVLVAKIPDQRQRNKTRERYVLDAHKLLKKLAAAQNADAMFFLADCHGRGALGLEPDNKEAFTLYQSAAKAGHAAAAYRTAVCCELGNDEGGGTRKDPLKAIQWYKRAALLGDTPAMYKMGMIQLKGLLGQARNPREAVGWLKRAADRADAENPHALHELGLLYEQAQENDSSIVRDEAYALQLFQQAAELGYKFSQFRLGCAYEYGLLGCPIDPRQSIMWYSRAAVQEEHQSELALSGWYLTGSEGVLQQSDTEAYLWARKAAMAGLAKAEYAMGYFTEVGIGSPANLEDAKRWYWRAAGLGIEGNRQIREMIMSGYVYISKR